MSTAASPLAQPRSSVSPALCLIAGWLVPGAGHLLVRKPLRALLLFVSIVAMFGIGVGLGGKMYAPNTGDLLDILGFAGQLGSGALFLASRVLDFGHTTVRTAMEDYGTKFIVVSGLLNIVAAVDAHSLASGRKAS